MLNRILIGFCIGLFALTVDARESWQTALGKMLLGTNVTELNRTNCVKIMLPALQSNSVVKALVFMPGATDEFYMFRRVKVLLTNSSPTLLDAVTALTNQSYIKATFHAPLLLLHTDEDSLEPIKVILYDPTAVRIKHRKFPKHVVCNDRDWDFILPALEKSFGVRFLPELYSRDSWHFYRHTFAAWNLDGMQALEVIALAGKSKFTIEPKLVVFEGDTRTKPAPKLDHYPDYSH